MSVCSKCGLNYCGTFLSPYTDGCLCQGCRTQHDLDQAYETIKQLRSELEALRKENDEIRMLNIEVTRTNSRFCVELEAERGKVAKWINAKLELPNPYDMVVVICDRIRRFGYVDSDYNWKIHSDLRVDEKQVSVTGMEVTHWLKGVPENPEELRRTE